MVAFDSATHNWSDTLPGKDGTKNEHYRIFGKPVRAMADGIVVGFKSGAVEFPVLPANPRHARRRFR